MNGKKRTFIIIQIIIVVLLVIYASFTSVIIGESVLNGDKWNYYYYTGRKYINKITNTVDLTVPKLFIDILGEDFDYTLTDEQIKQGFTGISKNAAGDVVLTIPKEKYQIFIDELKDNTKQTLKEQIEDLNGTNTYIHSVKYSTDLDNFKVYVDEEQYDYSLDQINISLFALTAYVYQIYDVDSAKNVKVEIINYETKKVIKTYNYPDETN